MAEKGAYIQDVHSLEQLSQTIDDTGKKMANIHENISSYIYRVKDALDRQLDFLREKLEEAEERLNEAESALSSCQASQIFVPELGGYVPSCISEEVAVASAREEVAEWQHKYSEGQRVVGECQNEISDFNSQTGGKGLIENMAKNQTPSATHQLRDCINKLQDILTSDVQGELANQDNHANVTPRKQSAIDADDKRFADFRNNIQGLHK